MIPKSLLAVLLVTLVSCNNTTIDCSAEQHSCFGTPADCEPDTDCNVLFHFDPQGNLDVKMRDVVDYNRYIAVAVSVRADLAKEYVICIPHQQRRMRGVAKQGEPIQIVEQHMARYVRHMSDDEFVCTFLKSELPNDFSNQTVFSFADGIYSENMIVPTVEQLQPVTSTSEYFYSYPVAARSFERSDSVLSVDESKRTSDLLGRMRRISGGDDDEELGALLGKKHRKSEESEDEGEAEDLDDMLDSRKKYSTRRRQEQKKASRRQREEEEEEEGPRRKHNSRGRPSRYEEDEEKEGEDIPRKKSRRPTSRRENSDEEEEDAFDDDKDGNPKKTNNKKGKDEEEEESDFDDFEDSSNGFHLFNLLALIAALVFFMIDN